MVRGSCSARNCPLHGNVAWRGLVPAERVAHLDLGSVTGVWMGPTAASSSITSSGKTFNWIGISRSDQPAREILVRGRRTEDVFAEYDGWHSTIRTIIAETPKVLRSSAIRPRTAARLAGRPRRAAGRCRASDDAVLCPGRRPKYRGRLRVGGLHRRRPDRPLGRSRDMSGFGSHGPRGCRTSPAARKNSTR